VGTLTTLGRRGTTSRNTGGRFILRIVSFPQARQRLERTLPRLAAELEQEKKAMTGIFKTNDHLRSQGDLRIANNDYEEDDECSLLCCWEWESSWDGATMLSGTERHTALENCHQQYKRLRKLH